MCKAMMLLILPAVTVLWSAAAPAQEFEPPAERTPPTLTVTGQGRVSAAPDRAVVRLGAVAQADEAQAAQQQVNQVVQRALDAIRGVGVPDERIRTVGLSLFPVYSQPEPRPQRGQPEEPRIVGYRASNTVEVTLDDLDLVGQVIDAGVGAGANQLEGLSFELRDDIEQRQQALQRAVEEARAKAQTLAEALGVQLAGVYRASEGGIGVYQPQMRGAMMYARAEMATPVEPGQVEVQASVTVTYRIGGPGAAAPTVRPGAPRGTGAEMQEGQR